MSTTCEILETTYSDLLGLSANADLLNELNVIKALEGDESKVIEVAFRTFKLERVLVARRLLRKADKLGIGPPTGLIGHDFEDYLTILLEGSGSFREGGREFDGKVGNRWWEAKSGNYWLHTIKNPRALVNFKSSMGQRLRLAKDNGATLELFSNSAIPDDIKNWLINTTTRVTSTKVG